VVARNVESALLARNVTSDERYRYIDVKQHTALQAVHVVVPIDPTVVATGLVGERQFLNQPMLSQEMQRSIDRAIGNPRVTPPHPLEDFAGREMSIRRPNLVQDLDSLRRIFESGSNQRGHQNTTNLNENESY
jgi:hypothetical protein